VICREPPEFIAVQQIRPTVTDVAHFEPAVGLEYAKSERRSHPRQCRFFDDALNDGLVGRGDALGGGALTGDSRLKGEPACHLSACVTTHPVGDGGNQRPFIGAGLFRPDGILVLGAE
jgi:hypothetical protein